MTKTELLIKLDELYCEMSQDPEASHCLAVQYLLDFIDDPEITKIFKEIDRWYP